MFHRVPEPELMEDAEQAAAYSDADFAAPHEMCVDRFVASWPAARGSITGIALDLGCGPADVVVRTAKRCPGLVIDGVDGAEAMLAHGRLRIEREGLANRVRLYRAFLPHDLLPRTGYDVVISNSILHQLHDPTVLWKTLWKGAAKGAHVFMMDLRRPTSTEEASAIVDRYAKGEPEILRRDFDASLCAAFTPAEVRAQLDAAGLSALAVEVISDRHLTISGVMP
ncbi:MAG: class I SAM-dependent methyltransferase [Deltaproteobacteria bacterium]|nr:class I SAM-dependent methyltransferase [Deltaproteobacteria bacterium]